jgi:2-iminobutanoate/2-iminopropanoate deaminase
MKRFGLLLPLLIPSTLADARPPERPPVEYFRRPGSAAPFSPAVRVGDTLYLSGMIGARPDGVLPEAFEEQAKQAMDNLGTVLAMAGRGWADVVHCTVMLNDMADWPAFNRLYVGYFAGHNLPARSAFGTKGLALGAKVEIECQAYAPAGPADGSGRMP